MKHAETTQDVRVVGIKATTIAAFEATLFGFVGLLTGIIYSLGAVIDFAGSTDSILEGMAFGLAQGFLAIILVPIIYFAVGWIIGLIHGVFFNAIVKSSGGIVLRTKTNSTEK